MRIKLENRMSRKNGAVSYKDLKKGDAFVFDDDDPDNPEHWCVVVGSVSFGEIYHLNFRSCELRRFREVDMVIPVYGVKIIREAE